MVTMWPNNQNLSKIKAMRASWVTRDRSISNSAKSSEVRQPYAMKNLRAGWPLGFTMWFGKVSRCFEE